MKNATGIAPQNRGQALMKWRAALGWDLGETARRLGVTTRTVTSDESGAQVMPDGRWRLFLYEVAEALRADNDVGSLVVVTADDHVSVLDVVSSDNFAGIAFSDDGKIGVIASYAVDRQTGNPYLHRQEFSVKVNSHLVKIVEEWEQERRAQAENDTIYLMHRWITRRALKGEIERPELADLKLAMNEANNKLKAAVSASDEERNRLFDEHEAAVAALIEAVVKSPTKKE